MTVHCPCSIVPSVVHTWHHIPSPPITCQRSEHPGSRLCITHGLLNPRIIAYQAHNVKGPRVKKKNKQTKKTTLYNQCLQPVCSVEGWPIIFCSSQNYVHPHSPQCHFHEQRCWSSMHARELLSCKLSHCSHLGNKVKWGDAAGDKALTTYSISNQSKSC